MFEYTVRSSSGRILMKTGDKEAADRMARNNNGTVKDRFDSVNPFKEEIWCDKRERKIK